MAYAKLRDLQMSIKLDEDGDEDIYSFPPAWSGLVKASKFTMKFRDKIPVPHQYKSKIDYPTPTCKFLAWELDFPMQEVIAAIDRKQYNSLLVSFLMGRDILPPLDLTTIKKMQRSLETQVAAATAGHTIRLRRIQK